MMNNYKRLFEQISPSESDEELIQKVLSRKAENTMKENNTPKTAKKVILRKAVAIPAAAVLVLGTAAVTAGAVNNWDYSKAFKGMFAEKYEGNVSVSEQVKEIPSDSSSEIADTAVEYVPEREIGTFDFEKYGKQLGIVMRGDGITATLDGMLVYDDLCYIMYTTEASDELLEKTGGEVPGLRIDFGNFGFKIDGKAAGGMGYKGEKISQDGNKRTGCIEIHYDSVDLAGKTLNCKFLAEAKINGVYTTILNQSKDILVDFPLAESFEKELGVKLTTDSFDGAIDKIKVSGFSSTLYISGKSSVPEPAVDLPEILPELAENGVFVRVYTDEDIETIKADYPNSALSDDLFAFGDAVVTLKDGTTVMAKHDGCHSHDKDGDMTAELRLRYTYPVDPADIASIAFGDYTFNFR